MHDYRLEEAARRFYDEYHKRRIRTPSESMKTTYWPALRGRTLEVGAGTLFPKREHYVLVDPSREAIRRAAAAPWPDQMGAAPLLEPG